MKSVMEMDDDEVVPLQTDLMPLKCTLKMVKTEKLYKGVLGGLGKWFSQKCLLHKCEKLSSAQCFNKRGSLLTHACKPRAREVEPRASLGAR